MCRPLERAYHPRPQGWAVGVDGVHEGAVRAENYRKNLENLHNGLEGQAIPASAHPDVSTSRRNNGKTRPIGYRRSRTEWSQDAIREVLQAIYEQDFWNARTGFRPGRSAHDAIRALTGWCTEGK